MRSFKEYRTIFFDLDGTLSDSKWGIIRCLQYSLGKFGIVEHDIDKLTRCIGPSLSFTYREWYGLSEDEARRATAFYRERFEREGILENTLYEGIPALLQSLQASGKRLAVATAKPTVHAKRILEYQGIAPYFSAVFGSNLDGTREDKSEVIAFALAELRLADRGTVLMVGDRSHDILGARENGLASIAVSYGYGAIEELKEARPNALARSVEELGQYLAGDPPFICNGLHF